MKVLVALRRTANKGHWKIIHLYAGDSGVNYVPFCQVPQGSRFKSRALEADKLASGSIPWAHTPGTWDVITCICWEAPFCTNSFILLLPVVQTEQQMLAHVQNNSLVATVPASNKHFVILHAPLHSHLQLHTPPPWSLLWTCLGQWHSNGWGGFSPLPQCLQVAASLLGSPPVLTKTSALHSVTFSLRLWPGSCKSRQIIRVPWNKGMCRPPDHHAVSGAVCKLVLMVKTVQLLFFAWTFWWFCSEQGCSPNFCFRWPFFSESSQFSSSWMPQKLGLKQHS